jgi:hypothetical protein
MKISKIFKKKKNSGNRSPAETQSESQTGSSTLTHRESAEIDIPNSLTPGSPPTAIAKRSVSSRTEETNGSPRRSNGADEPPSPSMLDETNNSEVDDLVSDMITPLANPKRKIKGVSESFKGLGVSHRFNVPQIEKSTVALRELSECYDVIPEMEQTRLPRGGISIETKAVGRVQVRASSTCETRSIVRPNRMNYFTLVWNTS